MYCSLMKSENLSTLAVFIADMLNYPREYGLSIPSGFDKLFKCGYSNAPKFYNDEEIYRKLYLLNLSAYHEYHNITPNESTRIPDFCPNRYAIPPRVLTHIQINKSACDIHTVISDDNTRSIYTIFPAHYAMLKIFECFLYQTNVGLYADCEFRKDMIDLRNGLEKFIISNTVEYAIAPWG